MPAPSALALAVLLLVSSSASGDPIGTQPRAMCDRHELCRGIIYDDDARRLACSLVATCYTAPSFDCLADASFSLKFGCAPLDCAEVLPFATSLQECGFWFPRVRNTPYVNLVAMRRSNPGAVAGRKAYAAAKGAKGEEKSSKG